MLPFDIPGARSATAEQAWIAFMTARLAYLEHQSSVTRAGVQAAYQVFALAMGLALGEARQASERLDAINGWEQSPAVIIGSIH
jgi:hypothetical protein